MQMREDLTHEWLKEVIDDICDYCAANGLMSAKYALQGALIILKHETESASKHKGLGARESSIEAKVVSIDYFRNLDT